MLHAAHIALYIQHTRRMCNARRNETDKCEIEIKMQRTNAKNKNEQREK